ncbi:MAG: hypothetical protein EOO91_01350 [Pedobacter sp.]|nr:MAG: hypothetical protein EOO91_01350 [Pedobacter sp.]
MSTSEKIHVLAIEYFEKFNQLKEHRRHLDYDMAKHLKTLESNNQSVNGKLAVLDYKDKIKNEEDFYLQLEEELKNIAEELKPLLVAINATSEEKLDTRIKGSTYIDSFLDEKGEIICRGPFTHIS